MQRAVGSQERIKNEVYRKEDKRRPDKGKKSFYCKMLNISLEGFRKYEKNRNRAWKYQPLADEMKQIVREDIHTEGRGCIRLLS